MKKIYLTLSFVIASGLLSAQNKDTKTADKLFDRYEYVDAAKEYNTDWRTAAYIVALKRLELTYKERGVFP